VIFIALVQEIMFLQAFLFDMDFTPVKFNSIKQDFILTKSGYFCSTE